MSKSEKIILTNIINNPELVEDQAQLADDDDQPQNEFDLQTCCIELVEGHTSVKLYNPEAKDIIDELREALEEAQNSLILSALAILRQSLKAEGNDKVLLCKEIKQKLRVFPSKDDLEYNKIPYFCQKVYQLPEDLQAIALGKELKNVYFE